MNISKNQAGFTAVELLLGIIAVALIIFVGVYVSRGHTTNATATVSQAGKKGATVSGSNNTDVSSLNAAEAVKRQLHITATFDGILKTVEPEIGPLNDDSVSFTDPAFSEAVAACQATPSQTGKPIIFAHVARVSGTYNPTSSESNPFAKFQQQFNGFYLEYTNPDGGYCDGPDTAKNQAVATLFGQLDTALQHAIKNAKQN